MNRPSWYIVGVYLLLLMVLTVLGQHNQALYQEQSTLLRTKQALQQDIVDLRAEQATIVSPAAVRTWAYEQGMVASPEGQEATLVIPIAPPPHDVDDPRSTLEFRTLWR